MLSPEQVTAVLVTRGDVELRPVLDSLIFPNVIVVDNSREGRDQMTYGRVVGAVRAKSTVVYSQDDDIIHSPEAQHEIVDAYERGFLTGCMWPEWSDGARQQGIDGGYDDLVFAGSGSIYDADLPSFHANRYLDFWPHDDFFRLWADTIIGVLAPTKQLDIRFDALPCADNDNRMANMPGAVEGKTEAIRRARAIRDLL